MNDAAFVRDRLQTALPRLQQRLRELRDDREDQDRRTFYDRVKDERDTLAGELRHWTISG